MALEFYSPPSSAVAKSYRHFASLDRMVVLLTEPHCTCDYNCVGLNGSVISLLAEEELQPTEKRDS